MDVLCINCGSSSLKWDLVRLTSDPESAEKLAGGTVDRIGKAPGASYRIAAEDPVDAPSSAYDHRGAAAEALTWLAENHPRLYGSIDAVGHRVVHGGDGFQAPTLIDQRVVERIGSLVRLAPLHNRPALEAIEASRQVLGPSIPMVATFDTAYFARMPARASLYAIDLELARRHAVRRYGFHGLAHRSMAEALIEEHGPDARLITLQLGNGCSATASRGRGPIDTSMGFTPLEGLVMGTRSGDLDASVPGYLARQEGLSAEEVEDLLNRRSGLLGISGLSSDMRDLLDAERKGDERAALAIDMFCYRVRKYVGAYAAALGGVDAIAFGGGIGENNPIIRERSLNGLEWLGLILDPGLNRAASGASARISAAGSTVDVRVIAVDESSIIAGDTRDCLAGA
jgi:acetate kinase